MKYTDGLVKLTRGNMTSGQFIRATKDRKGWKSMVAHVLEDMAQRGLRCLRNPELEESSVVTIIINKTPISEVQETKLSDIFKILCGVALKQVNHS
ncbi:hypothetical protein E2C01_001363 [Portunus trituberculatus]|uniref:Uncharacterized protein n=1 Tax=Portunus trituberculatus TaxID=210409 RepID=A0A5B7CGI8_PORTR|nr:hypothetical protein [Portunus trituberculatus]